MSNASRETENAITRGKGNAGTTAAATTILVKAVAVTPPEVAQTVHGGLGTTPPATAGTFDRTVVTSLGK